MLIIAGWLQIAAGGGDRYLDDCRDVLAAARAAAGCLDFCLSADPVVPDRIQVYERWLTSEALTAFRGAGPDTSPRDAIVEADVRRYQVTDVGPA